MKKLLIKNILPQDLEVFNSWYADEKSFFFSRPTKKWIQYIGENKHVLARKVEVDNKIVGIFQVDAEDNRGYVGVIVSPKFRGNGYGRKILELLESCVKGELSYLTSYIDKRNEVAIKLFLSSGYKYSGEDANGLFIYEKNI